MKRLTLAFCAAAMVLPAGAAIAATDNPFARDSVDMRTDDLNLATSDGQQRLEGRLSRAAEAVCGTGAATIHLSAFRKARACKAEVIAEVRQRIDAGEGAVVAAMH